MKVSTHTPSINIKRDLSENINYIPTSNAQSIYAQIISNYQKGSRSFNLIGAYGTGKSSFIVALEQSLNQQFCYFEKAKLFEDINRFEFVNIIGEDDSLIHVFAKEFNITQEKANPKEIIKAIDKHYKEIQSKQTALVLVLDEFGKFLEYAAKNNPERELYFVQQLAEYINDKSRDILFISILHQNFNAYSLELSESQFNEWTKVKGRLVELNYNESTEQLIYLAAERIQNKNTDKIQDLSIQEVNEFIRASDIFSLKDNYSLHISKKLYPFDLLSIYVLTLSLQQYAQNERSLFSFLENDDYLSISDFQQDNERFYNIACVYDYLVYYYHSFLSTKYNPHLNQWNAIKSSIERIESVIPEHVSQASMIVKVIGLLNIFGNKGGTIDDYFLSNYSKYCLNILDSGSVIQELISHKIIRFSKYDNRYKIFEGTDLDIELEIDRAGNLVEKVKDITFHLNRHFDFPKIAAKRVSYVTGTPRFFEFILTEEPVSKQPEDEIDGFINLIFNQNLAPENVQLYSKECSEAILFGHYRNTEEIGDVIFNIEKVRKVIERNIDDIIAVKELNKILLHYKYLLNHYVIERIYAKDKSIDWYFGGEKIEISKQRSFNHILSQICETIYPETPIFKNEMVNKTKNSSIISFARKTLISNLISNSTEENLGYDKNKYPPDKSIYLSLLKSTGIHRKVNGGYCLASPTDQSFQNLWSYSYKFLNKSKSSKLSVQELVNSLKMKPFKLKQGFIDFWIPVFLLATKNEYALYGSSNEFIPELNQDILDLINKSPKDYFIKAFDLTAKKTELFNKYREILNQVEEDRPTNSSFIETIKPFLTFYRNIPEYTKQTKRLSKKAIRLRSVLSNTKEPEKAFFEEFPQALGYTLTELEDDIKLEDFTIELKETIQEINAAFDKLIHEIEKYLNREIFGEDIGFPENKSLLQKRYKKLNKSVLSPKLKVFYQRIITLLDDRKSWINSISQACIGHNLERLNDEEIGKLKTQLIDNIRELDNLTDLSEKDIDSEKEELIKLEISSLAKGLSKKYIRIPLSKTKELAKLETSIKEQLDHNDQAINIALLTKLLQEQLKNDKEG